jgi:lipopolysaccharide transport system permease protein
MYATPVIYPLSAITNEKLKMYISLNPLTHILEAYRFVLLGSGELNLMGLAYSLGVMIILLFVGIILFDKVSKNSMDTV